MFVFTTVTVCSLGSLKTKIHQNTAARVLTKTRKVGRYTGFSDWFPNWFIRPWTLSELLLHYEPPGPRRSSRTWSGFWVWAVFLCSTYLEETAIEVQVCCNSVPSQPTWRLFCLRLPFTDQITHPLFLLGCHIYFIHFLSLNGFTSCATFKLCLDAFCFMKERWAGVQSDNSLTT